jgi:hypothetical protein
MKHSTPWRLRVVAVTALSAAVLLLIVPSLRSSDSANDLPIQRYSADVISADTMPAAEYIPEYVLEDG